MPPPTNHLNESVSHLADRVAGIASTLHLFEERMKSLTSSLGRLSALLLLQAGLPVGRAGMMFSAASYLFGSQRGPGGGVLGRYASGEFTPAAWQQRKAAQESQGADTHQLMREVLKAFPQEVKQSLEGLHGLAGDLKNVLVEQLGGHMAGARGRQYVAPSRLQQDLAAQQLGSVAAGEKRLVYFDTEYAPTHVKGPDGRERKIGDRFVPLSVGAYNDAGEWVSHQIPPIHPLSAAQAQGYRNITGRDPLPFVSEADTKARIVEALTALFESVGEQFDPADVQKTLGKVQLSAFGGAGDVQALNELLNYVNKGTGAPASPVSTSDVLEWRHAAEFQPALQKLAGMNKEGSLQNVAELVHPDPLKLFQGLQAKYGTGGLRGAKEYHHEALDAELIAALRPFLGSAGAPTPAPEAGKAAAALAGTASQKKPFSAQEIETRRRQLEQLAAEDATVTDPGTVNGGRNTGSSTVRPVPPAVKERRRRALERFNQQYPPPPPAGQEDARNFGPFGPDDARSFGPFGRPDVYDLAPHPDGPDAHLSAREAVLRRLGRQKGGERDWTPLDLLRSRRRYHGLGLDPDNPPYVAWWNAPGAALRYNLLPDGKGPLSDWSPGDGLAGSQQDTYGLEGDEVPVRRLGRALGLAPRPVDYKLNKDLKPRPYRRVNGFLGVEERSTAQMLANDVGAASSSRAGQALGLLGASAPHVRAFAMALGQASGVLGGLAKAASPDAFATLQGSLEITGALLGTMLVPATLRLTRSFQDLAVGLDKVSRSFLGRFVGGSLAAPFTAQRLGNRVLGWGVDHAAESAAIYADKVGLHSLAERIRLKDVPRGFDPREIRQAISLVSTKTTPQFSGLEDTYRKVQLDVLGKGPVEKILEKIHEETLVKMLKELEKANKNDGRPWTPFGTLF